MGLEKYLVKDFISQSDSQDKETVYSGVSQRVFFGLSEAVAITKKLWIWVLLGVGLGAFIHNYIPQEMIHLAISKTGFFSVPIAVALGVPMYGSCAAIVLVAVVLFNKGVPLGTALAFMMAVVALSLPEAIMLRRAMRLQLILIFFGVIAAAIIITGYVFNLLQLSILSSSL